LRAEPTICRISSRSLSNSLHRKRTEDRSNCTQSTFCSVGIVSPEGSHQVKTSLKRSVSVGAARLGSSTRGAIVFRDSCQVSYEISARENASTLVEAIPLRWSWLTRKGAESNIRSSSKCNGAPSLVRLLYESRVPMSVTAYHSGAPVRPGPFAFRSSPTIRRRGSQSRSRNEKGPVGRTFFEIRWEPLGYHHTWVETGTGVPAGERLHPALALLPWKHNKCCHIKQTKPELQGTFERHAREHQHQDHEDQQKCDVAAYCCEVCAFEQDLLYRAH
jgi:hypothetical protein